MFVHLVVYYCNGGHLCYGVSNSTLLPFSHNQHYPAFLEGEISPEF